MRARFFALGLTAFVALARPASAQSIGRMLESDFRNAGKDVLAIWASPFRGDAQDWATFAAALGAFGVSMLADRQAGNWAVGQDSSALGNVIRPLRRGGALYTGKNVVPPVAAVYLIGLATKNQDMRDFVMGCGVSWLAQSPPRKQLARLFGRARPDTTEGPSFEPNDPQIWKLGGGGQWVMRSFPGGHFANAMGCAAYWSKRFELGVGEPILYAVAGAIGVGRMIDRAHWFSDQLIGGVLGYAIGNEIARRSLARRHAQTRPAVNLQPGTRGTMLSVSWTF